MFWALLIICNNNDPFLKHVVGVKSGFLTITLCTLVLIKIMSHVCVRVNFCGVKISGFAKCVQRYTTKTIFQTVYSACFLKKEIAGNFYTPLIFFSYQHPIFNVIQSHMKLNQIFQDERFQGVPYIIFWAIEKINCKQHKGHIYYHARFSSVDARQIIFFR